MLHRKMLSLKGKRNKKWIGVGRADDTVLHAPRSGILNFRVSIYKYQRSLPKSCRCLPDRCVSRDACDTSAQCRRTNTSCSEYSRPRHLSSPRDLARILSKASKARLFDCFFSLFLYLIDHLYSAFILSLAKRISFRREGTSTKFCYKVLITDKCEQ